MPAAFRILSLCRSGSVTTLALLLVSAIGPTASAQQTPTFSLKAVKVNDVAVEPTNRIFASGTGVIESEVFISEWSPQGQRLGSFQWALDTRTLRSGMCGEMRILEGRRACADDSICGDLAVTCGRDCFSNNDCADLGTTCVVGRCSGWNGFCAIADDRANGVILNPAHVSPLHVPDYVFAGCSNIFVTDLAGPRCGAAVLSIGCAPVYSPPPKYAGTIKLQPSYDACGIFTIELLPPFDSIMYAAVGHLIEPLRLEPLVIDTGCHCHPYFIKSDPADCSIDPRQASEPDGTNIAGPSSMILISNFDTWGLTCSNFFITQVPTGSPLLSCFSVIPRYGGVNEQILVSFDRRVTPMRWTCIAFAVGGEPYGETFCFNHFPGDVDQSGRVEPILDVVRLLDCVEGSFPCPLENCDVDRSGFCGPKDLLRLGDLENGGDSYAPARGLSIAECPCAP